MQIDMKLATVEWLEAWLAKMAENSATAFYARNCQLDLPTAQFRYIAEQLEIYIPRAVVQSDRVVIYTSSLDGRSTRDLIGTEFILEKGTATLYDISADSYYEPYDHEPSLRLEITFKVQKEGDN